MMGENDAPVTGKGILERLQFNDDGSLTVSVGRVKRIETVKSFLEFCVVKKGIDERFLPPPQTIIKELKAVGVKKTKSKNSGKAARDPKLKAYAKKDVIQLIHQIVKDNVLDRIQNRELKDIRNLLIDKENQNIINVTDY